MLPTLESHFKLTTKIIKQLSQDVEEFLKSGKLLSGYEFRRPDSKENGYSIGPDSKLDIVVDWFSSLEQIYSKNFENCSFFSELNEHIKLFYNSECGPPRIDDDNLCINETKEFVAALIKQETFENTKYNIQSVEAFAKESYANLTRLEDEYFVEVPLIGIEIQHEIKFKNGVFKQLSFDERISFMRERKNSKSTMSRSDIDFNILNAHTVLITSVVIPRNANTIRLFPIALQLQLHNILQLTRLFLYGGVHDCFQVYYLNFLGKRQCGVMGFIDRIPHRKNQLVENETELSAFLNTNLFEQNFESTHELAFIFDRISDIWRRSRSNNYQVFDYVSILEAILIPANSSEISFKVSILTAALISENEIQKKAVFELVRKAYKIRSAVAHCKSEIKAKEVMDVVEIENFGKLVHMVIRLAFNFGVKSLRQRAHLKMLS